MKNLETSRDEMARRLAALSPDSPRRWGTMSSHQMLCHVADLFRVALGERESRDRSRVFQRTLLKWYALRAPFRWPRNVRTLREVRAGDGGSPPGDFDEDRVAVVELMDRLLSAGGGLGPHPLFGPLSRNEWLRWAYLHTDHHLRQFGV